MYNVILKQKREIKKICRQCRCRKFHPWIRKIPWRREWLPTPIFLLGKSHGQRSLVGDSPRRHKRVRHNFATKQQQQLTTLLKAYLSLLDDIRPHTGVELDAFTLGMPSRSLNLKVCIVLHVSLLSRVQLFTTPWTVAYEALPSMGFSRQEYLSGFPFPSPGDLPNPGDRSRVSCIASRRFTL